MSRELHNLYREAGGSSAGIQKVLVREGSVELRIDDTGEDEVMLQRVFSRRDGSVVVQLLPLAGVGELIEFRESDPYKEMLAQRYRACLDAIGHRVHTRSEAPCPASVSECSSELDVLSLMRAVCRRHGGSFALFHWLSTTPGSAASRATYDTHVILAACSPGWLQTYVRRVVTDPVLEYARNEHFPVRGLGMFGGSGGSRMGSEAEHHGLHSHVFFPANRGGGHGRAFGLLHVGSDAPEGEERLWQGQRELRGLAEELLDWPSIRFRRTATVQYGLSDAERIILEWIRRGGDARHAAADLSMTQRQVYRLYKSIKKKLGLDDIRACARMAADVGLLGRFN
jgi:DNA-binding CsgD family transcriptional regulator